MKFNKKIKKTIIIGWICILFVAFVPSVNAANSYTDGYFEYVLTGHSITITGYFGQETEVTVPAMIAGDPVNKIGKGAFVRTSAKKIYLPDTIEEIEEGALDIGVAVVYNSNTDQPIESAVNETQAASSFKLKDEAGNLIVEEFAENNKDQMDKKDYFESETEVFEDEGDDKHQIGNGSSLSESENWVAIAAIVAGVIIVVIAVFIIVKKRRTGSENKKE